MVSDPLSDAAVRFGHHVLLDTLGEFGLLGADGELTADVEALRGAAAFLRHEVVPFARGEERLLGPGAPGYESASFDHAFLAAEIEAFAREVDALARTTASGAAAVTGSGSAHARVLRLAHRIEAILELHVQKGDDPELAPGAARASARASGEPDDAPAVRASGGRVLSRAEAVAFLRRQSWGVLATSNEGIPYAVPVAYGFDGHDLFVASGPGRKCDALRANPAVCLTVTEVRRGGEDWGSVVAIGDAQPVEGVRARLHAVTAIGRQQVLRGTLPAHAVTRLGRATLFRISPTELTGRERRG